MTETQPNLVRVEPRPDGGKRYVLLDAAGPGAIVRIWSATPGGNAAHLHRRRSAPRRSRRRWPPCCAASVAPFAAPLAHVTARGHNLYFPFPFARRCVVTVDDIVSPDPFTGRPIAKLYYQIGYRRYRAEQAAHVRPYSAAELARGRADDRARRGGAARRAAGAPRPPRPARAVDDRRRRPSTPGHPSITTDRRRRRAAAS